MRIDDPARIDDLDFDKQGGLVPVIAQDALTGEVLMLAYADRDAVRRTLESGELWLRSRSRDEPWHKGATSGNRLRVDGLVADCDRDMLLARVRPAGPACHTGQRSCFGAPPLLRELGDVIDERGRRKDPGSWTARLLGDENLRLKKLGEEAVELALACTRGDRPAVASEAADLLYHLLVAAAAVEVDLDDVLDALARRRGG